MITKAKTSTQTGTSKKLKQTTGDTLHHLAFDNSLQANIISTVSTGVIIAANIAASKLLGYTKEELLTKNREAIFDKNESSFKKMLKQRTTEGQSTGFVTAVKKSGEILPCEVTSAVFIEDSVEKAITTITDLSKSILKQKNIDTKREKVVATNIVIAQIKSDVRLAENNEWIKYIAKNSYDVMWDWDLTTGEIYVGDSILEVFGYEVKNNTVNLKDLRRCIPFEEKDIVEKKLHEILASNSRSWNDSFTFRRYDGSAASATGRASIVRDENRKAIRMIGALQDITKMQELKNKLEGQKDIENDMNASLNVLWDWNVLTNEICIGEGFKELLGYTNQSDDTSFNDWRNYLHPLDRVATEKTLQQAIETPHANWLHTHRLVGADGSTTRILNRASIFRDDNEKAYRLVGIMQNDTSQKENKCKGDGLIEDKKSKLTGKIKSVVLELVYHFNEKLETNFSDYLSTLLMYDYTYLSNLFTEFEGMSIQQYVITKKIERVKELIETNELTLTQIAKKLQYSSVAHLSNQFKKFTGLTPTEFKVQRK